MADQKIEHEEVRHYSKGHIHWERHHKLPFGVS